RERNHNDEVLFFDHDRWPASELGAFVLTVPTKKVAVGEVPPMPSETAFERTLADLLTEDLNLGLRRRHFGHRLRPLSLSLDSQTRRMPTMYHIVPVTLPLAVAERRRVERRLNGEWLTVEDALSHPRLSPTARHVLEQSGLRSRRSPLRREPSS